VLKEVLSVTVSFVDKLFLQILALRDKMNQNSTGITMVTVIKKYSGNTLKHQK